MIVLSLVAGFIFVVVGTYGDSLEHLVCGVLLLTFGGIGGTQ